MLKNTDGAAVLEMLEKKDAPDSDEEEANGSLAAMFDGENGGGMTPVLVGSGAVVALAVVGLLVRRRQKKAQG